MIRDSMNDYRSTFYLVYTAYGYVSPSIREMKCSMSVEKAAIFKSPDEAEECAKMADEKFGSATIYKFPGGDAYAPGEYQLDSDD